MKISGLIKHVIRNNDRVSYGFISPTTPISGHEGDIRFFADKLIGISIDDLAKGDVVEFSLYDWRRRNGNIEKVAEDVCLLEKFAQAKIAPNLVSSDSSPESFSAIDRLTGVINWVSLEKGMGFIKPDQYLEGQSEDIRFFSDNLDGLRIDELSKGNRVEFSFRNWKREDGTVVKVAKEIRLLSKVEGNAIEETSSSKLDDVKSTKKTILLSLKNILTISDPLEFEEYVFLLLRLLGIHKLYQYPRSNQAGKADGFFILGSLAVMYDCTKRGDYEEFKDTQIENFVNQLKKSEITIPIRTTDGGTGKKKHAIEGKNRQVWIITQDKSRELIDVDGIRVKEVSVRDLMQLLTRKIFSDAFEEDDLASNLAVIDRVVA